MLFMEVNGSYKMKQNIKNQTISALYTDDKKSKNSSNPNDILTKNIYEKFYSKKYPPKLPLANFLKEFLTEKKCQMNNFTIVRLTFF